jgi:Tfp pilus assembly protein PilO
MMRLAKRERILFYVTVAVVLTALMQKFVFQSLGNKLEALNRDILIQEKALRKSLRTYNLREKILDDYRRYGEYLRIEGTEEEITARLLKDIEKLARKSGVYLVDIKPHPSKEASYYKKFIIEIQTEATMEEVIKFIYYLHKSPLPLRVGKLALVSKKQSRPTILKGAMFINAIFYKSRK